MQVALFPLGDMSQDSQQLSKSSAFNPDIHIYRSFLVHKDV